MIALFASSKVHTLTKINPSQPYFHMYISVSFVSQLVRNIGIAVFTGIAVFAHLRRLNIVTVILLLDVFITIIVLLGVFAITKVLLGVFTLITVLLGVYDIAVNPLGDFIVVIYISVHST